MESDHEAVAPAWVSLRAAKAAEQAEILLRASGGAPVKLRLSTGLAAADVNGLGLTAMNFEDVELGPALMSIGEGGAREIQFAAVSAERLAISRSTTARDMLASVGGVMIEDEMVPVRKVERQYIGLIEYMYKLVLSE